MSGCERQGMQVGYEGGGRFVISVDAERLGFLEWGLGLLADDWESIGLDEKASQARDMVAQLRDANDKLFAELLKAA